MQLRLRPIDRWPGRLRDPSERRGSPFSASYHQTRQLLDYELGQIGVSEAVLQIAVDERDLRLNGDLRANARPPRHPGVVLAFNHPRQGDLSIPCDTFLGAGRWTERGWEQGKPWESNLRAIALSLEALRKVDRYGVAAVGEQYAGWRQLGSGIPMLGRQAMDREQAARLLCEATRDEVGEDWRDVLDGRSSVRQLYADAAKVHHPDRGGDADLFRQLTEARDVLLATG